MPVLDIVLTKINAERKEKIDKIEKASIGFPEFENIEKVEESKGILRISFGIKIGYKPEAANVDMEGFMIYKADDPDKVIKAWKDNKKLEKDVGMEVLNVIYSTCLSKTVKIYEDMKLPVNALINMPKIEVKKQQAQKQEAEKEKGKKEESEEEKEKKENQ